MAVVRNIDLSDEHFAILRQLVHQHTGISLSEAKRELVKRRFGPRLRELGINNFKEYCNLIATGNPEELSRFTNAITTNLTYFFREQHHFDFLRNKVIPGLLEKNKASRRIRIWSAGCSTGEEPYSIAMTVRETIPNLSNWDVKILATDIDTDILKHASRGVYPVSKIENLSQEQFGKWFTRGSGDMLGHIKAKDKLRELIFFKHLNLIGDWPIHGKFDVIFCRNVIIYFDTPTKTKLIERYARHQNPGDHLFLGHSESLHRIACDYSAVGQTIYQKG